MNEFEKDLYEAITDVMFKYRDYPIMEQPKEVKKSAIRLIDKFFENIEDDED